MVLTTVTAENIGMAMGMELNTVKATTRANYENFSRKSV